MKSQSPGSYAQTWIFIDPEEESPVQYLHVSTRSQHGHTVVDLRGDLDIASVDDLRGQLRSVRQTHGDHLILDLTDLDFMDSQGLSVLIGCHKAVSAAGGSLALVAPRPIVKRTLEITGLNRRFAIFNTVAEASGQPAGA
ncbi:STAS domain-containing protein [Actinomadura scrupuli]|uniref:STAS domain-containing protein n=1 Tax=Actinomadura scrupuli TaxID=559629 RepID=UPI003D95376D